MAEPAWKRGLDKANAGDAVARSRAAARAKTNAKSLDEALYSFIGDKLGAEAFFAHFWGGTGEDRRALLAYVARRLPQKVEGEVDHSLTIKVVSLAGPTQELRIGPGYHLHAPKDVTPPPLPEVAHGPEDEDA